MSLEYALVFNYTLNDYYGIKKNYWTPTVFQALEHAPTHLTHISPGQEWLYFHLLFAGKETETWRNRVTPSASHSQFRVWAYVSNCIFLSWWIPTLPYSSCFFLQTSAVSHCLSKYSGGPVKPFQWPLRPTWSNPPSPVRTPLWQLSASFTLH